MVGLMLETWMIKGPPVIQACNQNLDDLEGYKDVVPRDESHAWIGTA